MADTNDIVKAATALGALIATHPLVAEYKSLIRQLDLDVSARTLIQQYEQLIETLSMKEAQMQPIEVREKQQFEQLQQSISLHPLLRKFGETQQQYMALMKQVQDSINAGATKGPDANAGGAGATPAAAPAAPSKIILDT